MIENELVSIIMPCFNAHDTLPRAISSVIAQTYGNWELIFVDDGSTDDSAAVVARINDPRIKLIRLSENRGRGIARQVALENCRGVYICMLDADDWMYPNRIQAQISVFRRYPEISLVSSGFAIVDNTQDIISARFTGNDQVQGPYSGPVSPVATASSMLLRSVVVRKDLRYEACMLLGQDSLFMALFLQGERYIRMSSILYAYSEPMSVTAMKAANSMRYVRRQACTFMSEYPREALWMWGSSFGKEFVYRIASLCRLDSIVLKRRSRTPTLEECEAHATARVQVEEQIMALFR